MVTDTAAYIGTSNWSGDYFINTAGKLQCHFYESKITQIRVVKFYGAYHLYINHLKCQESLDCIFFFAKIYFDISI